MKTLIATAALVLTLSCPLAAETTAQPHEAGVTDTGLISNGFRINGLRLNGLDWNGVKFNGLDWNGVKFNGLDWNGTELEISLNPFAGLDRLPLGQ